MNSGNNYDWYCEEIHDFSHTQSQGSVKIMALLNAYVKKSFNNVV